MLHNNTQKQLDELSYEVIGAAIEVHKVMGRGLLESVYQRCMLTELVNRKISFHTEMKIPVFYKEQALDIDFRCDLYIENSLVVELKAVQEMHLAFEAQPLNYMNLLKSPKRILINFNCSNIFKEGQKTNVNRFFETRSLH